MYYLRLIVYRQSVLPPVLLFLAILAFVYSGDAGPPIPAVAATSIVLMPVAAWMSRLTGTVESARFAEITAVALGGRARQSVAQSMAAIAAGTGLSILAVA